LATERAAKVKTQAKIIRYSTDPDLTPLPQHRGKVNTSETLRRWREWFFAGSIGSHLEHADLLQRGRLAIEALYTDERRIVRDGDGSELVEFEV
jgi:hypothetical protein